MKFLSKVSSHLNKWFGSGEETLKNVEALEVQLQALEERVLYSAAPVPIELMVEQQAANPGFEQIDSQLDFISGAVEQLQQESTAESNYLFQSEENSDAIVQAGDFATEQTFELVLIDAGVDDYRQIYDDALQNYDLDLVEVRLIESSVDGVGEISRILADAANNGIAYTALHIVSHGDAGEINLGNAVLDSDSLPGYSGQISSWANGLSENADILIYGCDFAADEVGQLLVDEISLLSGADVAASDDLTGHTSLGGDWELEYTAGLIESDIVFSATIVESWNHTLGSTLGDEVGTTHKSVGADSAGNQTIVASNDDSGSWNVLVSRFAADGETPLKLADGSDFVNVQVNDPSASPAGGDHRHAVVASAPDGSFAVAWVWSDDAGTATAVQFRGFDPLGNETIGQFGIGTGSSNVTVATNDVGEIVVGWEFHDGSVNAGYYSVYDSSTGALTQGPVRIDATGGDVGGFVVSINNSGDVAAAFNGADPDIAHVYVSSSGSSTTYDYSSIAASNIEEVAVDINDQGQIGIAFVADVGPFSAKNQDIYSVLLEYDSAANSISNISPITNISSGFGGVSIQAIAHSGNDAGLEYSPSIALGNVDTSGAQDATPFNVTWHGQGSWKRNLDEGLVVDTNGATVADESAFPSGSTDAVNGVFISETTFFADGSVSQQAERSLQNELVDFNSEAKHVSVTTYDSRSEFVTAFETAAGEVASVSSTFERLPVALDSSRTGLELAGITFAASDFGMSDIDSDPLDSIRVDSLPAVGQLRFNGVPIDQTDIDAGGVEISASDLGNLRFIAPDQIVGEDVASFLFSVNDGTSWSAASATMTLSLDAEDRLWLSTNGDPASGPIPGDGTGAIQFGGPNLTYGDGTTVGFWSEQFAPAGLDIDGLHYVESSVDVGSTSAMTLNPGDILFSVNPSTSGPVAGPVDVVAPVIATLPTASGTVDVRPGDIVRFRPTSADYSTGEYEVVASLGQMQPVLSNDYDVNAFTVAQHDTVVGDRLVAAGAILFSDSNNPNDILLLQLDQPGTASSGAISVLVDGSEVGIGDTNAVSGLELVEGVTTAGGMVLDAGSLLISLDNGEAGIGVGVEDVFLLKLDTTSVFETASGTFEALFDGSSSGVGGDESDSATGIDAVSLLGSPNSNIPDLVIESLNEAITEDSVERFSPGHFASSATVANLKSVTITTLPDAIFGALKFRGQEVVAGQAIAADDLGFLIFEPTENESASNVSFGYRIASEGGVNAEALYQFEVTSDANDGLFGGGNTLHTVSPNDIEVATPDGFDRITPHIAPLVGGDYVVIWHVESATESAIQIQRFDSDHNKVGGLIDFTDGSPNSRSLPNIAALTDGGFIAIATRDRGDADGIHVFATRYDSNGNKVLLEPSVDGVRGNVLRFGGSGSYDAGDVIGLGDDGFVVAAINDDGGISSIKGKVFHDGAFVNEIDISPSLAGVDYTDVTLAKTKFGGFVATWSENSILGTAVKVRFFDINGYPVGSTATLSTSRTVNSTPSISVLSNNQAVVVWGEDSAGDPSGDFRLVGAFVNSDGTVDSGVGENAFNYGSQAFDPDVIALGDGGFLVASSDADIDSSAQSIAVHRFDSTFARIGAADVLNADSAGSQSSPELALLSASGQMVAIWSSDGNGNPADIYANGYLQESTAFRGDRIPLDLTASIVSGADDQFVSLNISDLPVGTRVFANETGSGAEIELTGPSFDLSNVDIDSVEVLLPAGVDEAEFQFVVGVEEGSTSKVAMSQTQRMVASVLDTKVITGTLFNDINADGLIHDATKFGGVTVLLYEDVGGVQTQVASTTTGSDGTYQFTGLDEGTFFVVVDSKTIGADKVDDVADQSKVWAEQTYGGDGSVVGRLDDPTQSAGFLFGGRVADRSDDASTLATSEHIIRRELTATDVTVENVDFGFSFNVVTNVGDSYDNAAPEARTIQGSLRQFIENANYVSGGNHMRFVPAVDANASTDLDGDAATSEEWWSIDVVHELPVVTSSGTTIDGQAWRPTVSGLEGLDLNSFTVQNSHTGTVGANGTSFLEIDAPELELVGESSIAHGILVRADGSHSGLANVEINNLSIHGFGNASYDAAIRITGTEVGGLPNLTGVIIRGNVIGSAPNDLDTGTDPRTAEDFKGIYITGAADGVIANNIVTGNTSGGIRLDGFQAVSDWFIRDNEISFNGSLTGVSDGVDATGTEQISVSRNYIHSNAGMGIDEGAENAGSGAWLIDDNSIVGNGSGSDYEGSGIRLTGDGSSVLRNYIADNQNDGVTVSGYFDSSILVPGKQNLISQNQFENNGSGDGDHEIDLILDLFEGITFADWDTNNNGEIDASEASAAWSSQVYDALANAITADNIVQPDEVDSYYEATTAYAGGLTNDGVVNSYGANDGLDAPVITSAEFSGGQLNLELEILNPNVDRIELYTTKPAPNADDQAWEYFSTIPVSAMTDLGAGNYSLSIPESDFPAGTPRDTPLVALSIDANNNTSEFDGQPVAATSSSNAVPTTSDRSKATNEDASLSFVTADFPYADGDSDPFVELVIASIPPLDQGSLVLNGVTVVADQRIPVAEISDLQFVPASDFFGNSTFNFLVSDGVSDSAPATMAIQVASVSDAPTGTDATLTVAEDAHLHLTADRFGFDDSVDDPSPNSLARVRINSFTGSGTLTLNGNPVVGLEVLVASLSDLIYTPAANDYGTARATIEFTVIDDGSDVSSAATSNTLTIDVTPVSDAPTGADATFTIGEDETLTLTADRFGFSDSVDDPDPDSLARVRIDSVIGGGTLELSGTAIVGGQEINVNDLPNLVYTPAADENGTAYATIEFTVIDDGADANEDLSSNTLTINVTAQSDNPTGTSTQVSILEDETATFTEASFGFADSIDGSSASGADTFVSVRIEGVNGGTLMLNGVPLTAPTTVMRGEIPDLEFQPDVHVNGIAAASIDFVVIDSGAINNEDLLVRTRTYNITPVGDAPVGTSNMINVPEDGSMPFNGAMFGFTDPIDAAASGGANNFSSVRIVSFTGSGTLTFGGSPVSDGQLIAVGDLGNLQYEAAPNENGSALASIEFRVVDDAAVNNEDTSSRSLAINVLSVSDTPSGQSDTLTVQEDDALVFDSSTFGFTDSVDAGSNSGADNFASVRVVSFSGMGTLTLNGSPVLSGEVIPVGDLSGLIYRPVMNTNGAGLASIVFNVIDDGATQNESAASTLTIDVTPASDHPSGMTQTLTIDEEELVTFDSTTFGFSDGADNDSFAGVRIVSFGGSGTLQLNGVDVTPDQLITVAELPGLEFQPAINDFGTGISMIEFRVVDSGATDNEDLLVRSLTFNVNPTDDAPQGADTTITIQEDAVHTFEESNFGFSDVDGHALSGVRIVSFSGSGSLTLNGIAVMPNDVIPVADIPRLEYQPNLNDNGLGLASLEFRVIDDSGTVDEDIANRTITFNVDPVTDWPTGQSQTVTIDEDGSVTYDPSSFGYDSVDGSSFQAVRIVGFSGSGSLTLDGVDVAADTVIDAADLARLTYQPDANSYGTGISQLEFRVVADSADRTEDQNVQTITYNVTEVNDAPSGASTTGNAVENQSRGFTETDFGFDDSVDNGLYNFAGVRIVSFNGSGMLQLNGVDVVAGQMVTAAELPGLLYQSGMDEDGAGISTIDFTVVDSGTVNNEDPNVRTLTIDVANENRAPVVDAGQRFTTLENQVDSHEIQFSDPDGDDATLAFAAGANDNSLFEFTPDGRSIQFVVAPDFENPNSVSGTNTYVIDVVASDTFADDSAVQRIEVVVENFVEAIQLANDEMFDTGIDSVFENDNAAVPFPTQATVQVLVQPTSGTVAINSDGTVDFTPHDPGQAVGDIQFTYTVENGGEVTQADVLLKQVPPPTTTTTVTETTTEPEPTTEDPVTGGEEDPTTPGVDAAPPGEDDDDDEEVANVVANEGRPIVSGVNSSGADTLNNDIGDGQFGVDLGDGRSDVVYATYAYASFVDTGLLTAEFATRIGNAARAGIQEFTEEFAFDAIFWQELEDASHDFVQTEVGEIEAAFAVGALGFTGLTGLIVTRAALLGISLGATYAQPLWVSSFDFLPIIASKDEESIGQIVDNEKKSNR